MSMVLVGVETVFSVIVFTLRFTFQTIINSYYKEFQGREDIRVSCVFMQTVAILREKSPVLETKIIFSQVLKQRQKRPFHPENTRMILPENALFRAFHACQNGAFIAFYCAEGFGMREEVAVIRRQA